MSRVPHPLAVVNRLHRVLAGVERLKSAVVIEREQAEIGRDVAIDKVEVEENERGVRVGQFKTKPVETILALVPVVQVVHVIRRPVHVAAQDERVGVLPVIVRLRLDRVLLGGGQPDGRSLDQDGERTGRAGGLDREPNGATRSCPDREPEVRVAPMQGLAKRGAVGKPRLDPQLLGTREIAGTYGNQKAQNLVGVRFRQNPCDRGVWRDRDDLRQGASARPRDQSGEHNQTSPGASGTEGGGPDGRMHVGFVNSKRHGQRNLPSQSVGAKIGFDKPRRWSGPRPGVKAGELPVPLIHQSLNAFPVFVGVSASL